MLIPNAIIGNMQINVYKPKIISGIVTSKSYIYQPILLNTRFMHRNTKTVDFKNLNF